MLIEIFKIGEHTDANGMTRYWSAEDLDRIAETYNPEYHEAPVVIGHPKDNAPAYGWVEKLYREGSILFAKVKDLAPQFVEWLKHGLYKKRSVALYPDMSLRHVGFLGAQPPAIKGLADVQFSDESEVMFFEYEPENGVKFSESDMKRALAAQEAKMKAAYEKQARDKEIVEWVESVAARNIFPPAIINSGMVEFTQALGDQQGVEIEFSEGETMPPLEWFRGLVEGLAKLGSVFAPMFEELATTARAGDRKAFNEQQLGRELATRANRERQV